MSAKLEDTAELSRTITRSYYEGNMQPYFDRLCSKSIWLGTGGRVLIGGDVIRARLERVVRKKPCHILTISALSDHISWFSLYKCLR